MRTLTCEEAVRALFAYLDRALSGEPLDALEAHLRDCFDCCERRRFSQQLDGFVKARLGGGVVPAGVEGRLRARLAGRRRDANAHK